MSFLISFLIGVLIFSFLSSLIEGIFLSVTPAYVAALEKRGVHSGKLLHNLKQNTNRSLATILSFNTMVNTVGSTIIGGEVVALYGSAYLGMASALLTLCILIITEILPKTIGALYWRRLAPPAAYCLYYLSRLLYPLVTLIMLTTQKLSKNQVIYSFSREEFAALAELGVKEGQLKTQESRIVANLLRLRTSRLKDIMTPRTVIFSVSEQMTVGDFFSQHADVPFTRIPVYEQTQENITGFVLLSDILLAQARDRHNIPLSQFKRELQAIPSSLTLSHLFDFLLHSQYHMVLAINEYGEVEGIATLEDLVETLLGFEIVDESEKVADLQALARKRGALRAKHLGISPDKKNNQSRT